MKKYILKFVAVALLIATCVSLFCACGGQDDDEDEGFNPYPYKDLSVYIDLPDYKSFTVSQSDVDDMMRAELNSFCINNGLSLDITSGTAQRYDTVSIFYVCYADGMSIEELSAREVEGAYPIDLYIGSGALPFEDGVIGMAVNETKVIDLTLPQDYPYIAYRGKDVTFSVTVKAITRMPELTDKMCADNSVYENREEFMTALRENCIFDLMWQMLMGKCELKGYPDKEYTEYYQYFYGYFEALAEAEGMNLATFLDKRGGMYSSYGLWRGMTAMEFRELAQNYAKSNIVNDLLMYSIMRAEDIKLEGAEWDAAVAVLEREYGTTYKQLVKSAGETAAIISVLNIRIAKILNGYVTVTSD